MKGYIKDLNGQALKNTYFRHVLATGHNMQVVLMSLSPGEEIGMEVHPDSEQVLICLRGRGKCMINGQEDAFAEGDTVLVSPGSIHNFVNTGNNDMKIITLYSPPHHKNGTIHKTKAVAKEAEEDEP